MSSDVRARDGASTKVSAVSPWVAVGVILVGSSASTLDLSVIGVALPAIEEDFRGGGSAISADWIATAYLVGVVFALPLTDWLSGRLGRKAVYLASLALFGVGSFACALAPTLEAAVAGRFVQGLGGGALIPMGMAIVYDLFPPERRGAALGLWGLAVMAGPAAGPPLGGWVVTAVSWRWIFGLFVVVAAVSIALSLRWLPDTGEREPRRLDLVGWMLAAVGVTTLVVGSRRIGDWGPTSPGAGAVVVITIAIFGVLVRRSLRRADPIIEFRLFGVRTFGAAMAVTAMLSVGQIGQLTFLPVELQVVRQLDAYQVGLFLTPAALGTAVMMPVGGWLVDRVGARAPSVIGLSVTAFGMWELAHLEPDGSDASVVELLALQGVGIGLSFIPTTVAAMGSVPSRFVTQASVLTTLVRQLGGALGVAVLGAIVVAELGAVAPVDPPVDQAQDTYNLVFLVTFWIVAGAATVALLLPGRSATRQHQVERAAEAGDAEGAPVPAAEEVTSPSRT